MLVSVIIPTTPSRNELIKLAIQCYESQDYIEKQLIIVDDPGTIGRKLNLGCERSNGEIIIRFDDDDWSATHRITSQVTMLLHSKKKLTGYNSIYFWNMLTQSASFYRGALNYCLGTSMCFTRDYWESNKFPEKNIGEDLDFQKKAKAENNVISIPADQMMVARIHGNNTGSGKVNFPVVPKEKLPKEFFAAIGG